MKIAVFAFALAAIAVTTGARAETCYWDRAQQARVCHPSPAEREAWRRGREHGAREHERGYYEHEGVGLGHHHGWFYDHGYHRGW